ncbi:MAG: exopolysaccharide biosynthesis polyprenyl glycosylphosphotransferase [Verrucomicrobiota bacterium JB023]|nr:exopolysaccharide biosynthesis polyprenyl glycosylphosphotransferase [Verrucomicrobiota bacterium JB023]
MTSNRETGYYHAFLISQFFLLVTTYVATTVFVLALILEQQIPVLTYSKYLLCILAAFICEAVGRPGHLRFQTTHSKRLAWRVTVRQASTIALGLLFFLVFSQDNRISRGFLGVYAVVAVAVIYISNRYLFRHLVNSINKRSNRWNLRTMVIGPPEWTESISERLESSSEAISVDFVEHIETDATREEIKEKLKGKKIDLLVASAYYLDPDVTSFMIQKGERDGYRTWLPVEISRRLGRRFTVERVGGPYGTDFLTPPPAPLESTLNMLLKDLFDRLVAFVIVSTVLLPFAAVVWILQRIYSPGPLFFSQERMGVDNSTFKILKFRTMDVSNDDESRQAQKGDSRIYRGGGFLRKTSIDEFPQFLNVLMGQMSIVGPRPHMPCHEDEFQEYFERYGIRRHVKPGITGLAQVRGFRGEVNTPKDIRNRARHDILYIRRWSFFLDVRIMIGTAISVIIPHRTAY